MKKDPMKSDKRTNEEEASNEEDDRPETRQEEPVTLMWHLSSLLLLSHFNASKPKFSLAPSTV